MAEFDLIDLIRRRCDIARADVRLGIGDDAAIVAPTPGCELAISVDMLVEGRHFLAGVDPESLGHKALAVNLSDMAAMGARPRWALLGGALPDEIAAQRGVRRATIKSQLRSIFAKTRTRGQRDLMRLAFSLR